MKHSTPYLLAVLVGICATCAICQEKLSNSLQQSDLTTPLLTTPPAVEYLNGKVSYKGGLMESDEGHNFGASITFPIKHAFGLQLDGLYSHISSLDFYGAAGHLFWRNPERGLIGIAGGYLYRDGVDTFQIGSEVEYYIHRLTLGMFLGVGSISYSQPVPFIQTEFTKFVGSLKLDWYAIDELRAGISWMYAYDNQLLKVELEYQTPLPGLAITAEVALGEHHYDHVLFGLTYYLGANKTLRHTHRYLDPPSLMPQILYALGLYGVEFNRLAKSYYSNLGIHSFYDSVYGVWKIKRPPYDFTSSIGIPRDILDELIKSYENQPTHEGVPPFQENDITIRPRPSLPPP